MAIGSSVIPLPGDVGTLIVSRAAVYRHLPRVVQAIECGLLRLEANVRVVLEHPPRELAGNRFDHVIRLAGLEEPGDNGVTEVVEAQAGYAQQHPPTQFPSTTSRNNRVRRGVP